jgi:hypothetical protein
MRTAPQHLPSRHGRLRAPDRGAVVDPRGQLAGGAQVDDLRADRRSRPGTVESG